MSTVEDLVRRTYSQHASLAEVDAPLADRVVARRHRRTTRRWFSVAGAGLATAGVVLGVTVLQPGHPIQHGPGPVGRPIETQAVDYRSVEISVPASWILNHTDCGTALSDTVIVDHPDPQLCYRPSIKGLTVVSMLPTPAKPDVLSNSHAMTVDDQPTIVGKGTYGQTFQVFPRQHMELIVSSPDPTLIYQILNSARIVQEDSHGCGFTSDLALPDAPRSGFLVQGSPVSVSLCHYRLGYLDSSGSLSAAAVPPFVAELNSLADGKAIDTTALPLQDPRCTKEIRTGLVLRFRYADGSERDLIAHLEACDYFYVGDAQGTGKMTTALLMQLFRLAHLDEVVSGPLK